ncbi:WD40-repeat-containing domain protein [Biscogniauxia mediterranea]|nr:WD40-repeat-containing domain protein [Biscogniauxia mediterranea]
MRPLESPPVSPPLSPDRPADEQDAYLLNHLPESSFPATILPHHLDGYYDPAYYWSVYPSQSQVQAHHLAEAYGGPYSYSYSHHYEHEHDYDYDYGHGDSDGDGDDHDMLDAEEGGAPLTNSNMDDQDDFDIPSPPAAPTGPALHFSTSVPAPPLPPPATAATAAAATIQFPHIDPATLNALQDLQDLQEIQDDLDQPAPGGLGGHPGFIANANSMSLGPENPDVQQFLSFWVWQAEHNQLRDTVRVPCHIGDLAKLRASRIKLSDLKGDDYDVQGINWRHHGVSRALARERRIATFHNYVNRTHSDTWRGFLPDRLLPPVDNYFRYQSMDIRRDVRLLHFQLRNILGCASRTRVFYPSNSSVVRELDPTTGKSKIAMNFDNHQDAQVSTLTTGEDVLIVGSFYGKYRYRSLDSDYRDCMDGRLTDHVSGITNHVQVHSSRRSSVPLAAFASNDFGFRIVDLAENKIISETMYNYALNCSALSPDKRLRVMVGDHQNVTIADSETGEILQELAGHRDFGFACDWAPDGWTVATGNQDKSIRIWDARRWKNSNGDSTCVTVIRTEMAGARTLRFSPLGSGKRVLVAAEEADYINIIDAQMFSSKQTVDIFGELGGVSFANAGQDLIALSSDRWRGGVLRLERCDAGAEDTFDYGQWPGYDWMQTPDQIVEQPDSQVTLTQKRRQAAMSEDWVF